MVALALGAVVLGALLLERLDWARLADTVRAGEWRLLLLAMVLNGLSAASKAVAWQGLVNGLPGARSRSRPWDLVPSLFAGALVNAAGVARAGDAAKVVLAQRRLRARRAEVSLGQLAGSVAAEHVVSTAAFGVFVAAAGLAGGLHPGGVLLTAGIGAGAVGVVVATGRRPPGILPPVESPSRRMRARRAIHAVWSGLHEAHRGCLGANASTVWTAGVAQWVFTAGAIACCLAAFGLPFSAGPTLAVLTGLTLAHALPVTPGGIGINQAGAMLPLTALYGVAPEPALAAVVGIGATETAVSLLAGGPCLLWEARRRRRHPAVAAPVREPDPPGDPVPELAAATTGS